MFIRYNRIGSNYSSLRQLSIRPKLFYGLNTTPEVAALVGVDYKTVANSCFSDLLHAATQNTIPDTPEALQDLVEDLRQFGVQTGAAIFWTKEWRHEKVLTY